MRLMQAHSFEDRNDAETFTCWRSPCLVRRPSECTNFSGNELVERMPPDIDKAETITDVYNAALYQGFVAGAFDAYAWAGMLCYPDQKVTLGQAEAIVSRYLKANPTKWHLPAVDLIQDALQSAFPCPK
jgi:hypothetical protein